MFTTNPFAAIADLIPPNVQQWYLIVMIIMVAGGTIIDMWHKKSAKYFFMDSEKAKKNAKRTVGTGEKVGLAVATVANEVLTSGEFANPKRRMSHLLTMYGFILFVVATVMMIFGSTAAILPKLWHIGASMLVVGGYWFWFFIRVDVNSEGVRWYQLRRADLFIVSLLLTATFALIWSYMQTNATRYGAIADMGWTSLFFGLFILSNTTLFSTVLWSKFAHMFFKPAAALQKRIAHADGSNLNLPADYDLTDPATQKRFPDIPEYMGTNPDYMGHGIRRESPNHY